MDQEKVDRFRQDLALQRLTDAARGGLFGSHRPMNTFAARLLEQPWHRALEQGTRDRVTVVFERELSTPSSVQYDITIRANVSVDSAVSVLKEIAETRRAPAPALITVKQCERHVSVEVSDGSLPA